jgi:uroporphyrinogen-III synthase
VAPVVIVTRPAAAGQQLAAALAHAGHRVAWWPAFDIVGPPDEALVDATLARLADYELAVFVSVNAVVATAGRLRQDWPRSTVIGAVGAATRAAALSFLRGGATATVVAPDDDDESGSEGFWRAWQASGRSAQRVLLLRAASGRDWIIERLHAAGARVDALPVYDRRARVLDAGERAALQAWARAGEAAQVVVSSTDAVTTLLDQVDVVAGAAQWLRQGVALATHPRVARRLQSAGFTRVETCAADDSAVIAKLESIAG